MNFAIRLFRSLRYYLLAVLLVCQCPLSTKAGYEAYASALQRLLRDLDFSSQQTKTLVTWALESNSGDRWLRYGKDTYRWLDTRLPVNTGKFIMMNPWLLGVSVADKLEPRIQTLKRLDIPVI